MNADLFLTTDYTDDADKMRRAKLAFKTIRVIRVIGGSIREFSHICAHLRSSAFICGCSRRKRRLGNFIVAGLPVR